MKTHVPNDPLSWREPLKTAFRHNSAFGLLVDYQKAYLKGSTWDAFHNGLKLAETLRAHKIPNYWAAWALQPRNNNTAPYGDTRLNGQDDFAIAVPTAKETVFIKYDFSVFNNPDAEALITKSTKPAIIMGGTYADECFAASLTDILKTTDCDVIVPYDATDFKSSRQVQDLYDQIERPKGRLHVTSTQQVVDALPHSLTF